MASVEEIAVFSSRKPHAVCIPFPVQSHIKAMLKFSKLLHRKGFSITFVNTEFNHNRLLRSTSSDHHHLLSAGFSDNHFRFETIPDGLPPSDPDSTQDILSLFDSTKKNFAAPFLQLLTKINDSAKEAGGGVVSLSPVTCLVADASMSFAIGSAAQQLGIPLVMFFPVAACTIMGLKQFRALLEKGILPLKDESSLTNDFLDTPIEWPVQKTKGVRLRDLPSFWRITDSDDFLFNIFIEIVEKASEASAIVIHTFDAIERDLLDALSSTLPNMYAIGPLQLLLNRLTKDPLEPIQYSLWKEETECLEWLNTQKPNSVIYVNFGSITVFTPQQVIEFGWGLANSSHPFFWVIRPDLVIGESACLSPEFLAETKERSLIASWCPQEDVLNHPSIGGFLTHCGWNSIIESLSCGVPMLCYPFFGDQQTNCRFVCNEWDVGLEIDNDVKRGQVKTLVKELMEKEKGKKMKSKAMEWKKLAEEATGAQGSSSMNFDNLVSQVLLPKN
ncbi:hypothetical protein TIFTF001_001638 [Ficus carica]|uniref:Glycosyltransferase n=1 Tax=Ficus carica TaxID=3494 RepID=A0AA87ZP16_FICCA|nr:hypothetical protein TIFTF001_001638 [Ficus carica]